jgi:hypothetical protein
LLYRDREGRVADFHSLRHRFVMELVRAGVAPKDAKELARHSTITLTMDRYAHVGIRDTAAAVGRLTHPTNSRPDTEPAALRLTGTDGVSNAGAAPGAAESGSRRVQSKITEESCTPARRNGGSQEPLELQAIGGTRGELRTEEDSMPDRS